MKALHVYRRHYLMIGIRHHSGRSPRFGAPARVAEILRTTADRLAMHESTDRRDPDALTATLEVVPDAIPADIKRIFLLDDMITTGCSFRVCKQLLQPFVPNMPIIGLFVSRRVLPDPLADFEDLDF